MPIVPYANTFRVVVHQSRLGEEAVNVHHLHWPIVGGDFGATAAIAVAFAAFYNATPVGPAPDRGIRTYRAGSSVLDYIRIYDLRTVPNPAVDEFTFADEVTPAGTAVPSDTAAVITLRTGVGGRSGRGRVYIGPLADTAMTGAVGTPGQFSIGFQQDLVDAYVDLQARLALITPGTSPQSSVLSVADGVNRPVTSITVDRRPDTQRRRDYGLTFGPSITSPV